MNKKTVVITGGGTGGHIYPGLAIAQEIRRLYPQVDVQFVGATGGLEEKILPKSDFPYHLIKVGRLHRSVGKWQQLKTLLYMPVSLFHAWRIFMKLKPVAVLGVGGFASGPFLLIGWLMRTRTALWEPNAHPGLTNRWLSRLVDICFVVFSEAQEFLHAGRVIEVGLPVRQEFFDFEKTIVGSPLFKVLVFGGSQGARAINEIMVKLVNQHPEILHKIQLRHQTGSTDYQRIRDLYGANLAHMTLLEYIHDMPTELHNADLVICRSGASTVAEVIACHKPAIFIPLPTAADNHQFKNAEVLARKQAGILIEQKNLSVEILRDYLLDFCDHRLKAQEMADKLQVFDFSGAGEKIAKNLLENRV
jgi:UDP-N-acetylglucosamine--N-acetylmuramyl-(pentapeptide) pyrophosphoryl-undecaprenol N-acetylglucosamine transferase